MAKTSINVFNGQEYRINATVAKVNSFFKHDFEKYLLLSGIHRTDLKSKVLTGITNHQNAINTNEELMQRIIHAETVVKCVSLAINDLEGEDKKPYKQIVTAVYLDQMTNTNAYLKIGYSKSRYYELKDKALCEFANRFEFYQLKYHVEPLIDLFDYARKNTNKTSQLKIIAV